MGLKEKSQVFGLHRHECGDFPPLTCIVNWSFIFGPVAKGDLRSDTLEINANRCIGLHILAQGIIIIICLRCIRMMTC